MITDGEQQVIELFVRHQTRIRGFIAALMGDFAAVPDVLQETFLVVQRKAGEFEPGSNFLAWAFQIARFQVMKAQNQHQRAAERFSDAVLEALAASAPEELLDESRISALYNCLEELAPQARRTVNLFYQDEHKPRAHCADHELDPFGRERRPVARPKVSPRMHRKPTWEEARMTDERLDRLIDAHLSGEMTDAERRELEERLLHSAADRARFWELAETHTVLHEAMQRQLAGCAALAETPPHASLLSAWWRRLPRFAIATPAVALVAAVGFVILWLIWPTGGLQPTLASMQGEVEILRDGQRIPADTGSRIMPGERIRTGPNASAELRLADGTSIRMDGSTDVGFLPGKAARQVEVKTGMVHCDVAKQPPGRPLVFQTPHADLTVLGTAFDLLAAPVESRARVHQGRVRWADGGPGVEVAAGEACTADSQGIQAWQPVCNLDFRTLKAVPPQLETVFCNEESLLTARRRIVPAPNGIRLEDGGLRFATLPHAFGEHGLVVTRWTEPVGGDVAIEVELSAAAKVDGDSTPPADPASERNPNWSLQIAVDGDSFDGYRVVFAAPKYPNGIEVDSIHPVEWMLLARDPRPMPEAGDHTLRVEKRGSQLRVWIDRELRIDTALSYPLAPDRKRTFALSEFGAGPLIRSLRVWRGGRD